MAPAMTVQKGEFSFLIALGKQLDRALEMCYDGSAPDFVTDAVGVLANALEGIAGAHVDDEVDNREPDDGVGDDDGEASGLPSAVADGSAGGRASPRIVGGTVRGTRPMTEFLPTRTLKRPTVNEKTRKRVKRGKTAKR